MTDFALVNDIPQEFFCPITNAVMVNPYIMPDGHTYEREVIKKWLDAKGTSPISREPMSFSEGIPNRSLMNMIDSFRQKLRPTTPMTFQILINTIEGKKYTLGINSKETVDSLKTKIFEKTNIKEKDQRLMHCGRQLKDGDKLKKYGVKKDSLIHVLLRLLGGI